MAPPAEISQTAGVTAYLRAFARVELYDGVQTGEVWPIIFCPPSGLNRCARPRRGPTSRKM